MNSQKGMGRDKIIVALDVATPAKAIALVEQLTPQIRFFKVGLQLYTAAGPEFLRELVARASRVFLDLKLHDIPNTVARAVDAASQLGVEMLTIHLSGGEAMIKAATDAAGDGLSIIGVTVLTSQTNETLGSTGIREKVDDHVLRLARLGVQGGVHGIVASAREITMLRTQLKDIQIITPGIRPSWSEVGDQKRITTPRQAIDAGADYLVIGRPITAHPDPAAAVKKILNELDN
jgi:orotidine-5'-phosphate decarboxylase